MIELFERDIIEDNRMSSKGNQLKWSREENSDIYLDKYAFKTSSSMVYLSGIKEAR